MRERTGLVVLMVVVFAGRAVDLPSQRDEAPTPERQAPGAAGELEAGDRVRILELKQVSAKSLTVSPGHFTTTTDSGQAREVPVAMQQQIYDVRAEVRLEDGLKEWSGRARCFELRSQDPEMPYAYAIWTGYVPAMDEAPQGELTYCWPGEDLRLFSLEGDERILAGSGQLGWWMDVSRPNDKTEALKRHILSVHVSPQAPVSPGQAALKGELIGQAAARFRLVPAVELLGDVPFAHAVGPAQITIEDIARKDVEHLVFRVKGIKSDKVYTLIFDGKQWQTE